MTKRIKIGGAFALAIFSIWLFFSPYLAAYSMKRAAENRDADKLSSYVDFPAVKESFKGQINAKVASDMAQISKDNPFSGLGVALAAAFISPMVDALVTPENLRSMMEGEKPKLGNSQTEPTTAKSGEPNKDIELDMAYKGLNQFSIVVWQKDKPEKITFILNRDGLISWKLVSIRLPL